MHQPLSTPRPSIYYPYRIFEAWLPGKGRDQHQSRLPAPIVIVGSGPVGLTTALELARHGVASIVLESELQVSEGSRAIVFTRRSMEIMQQVGIAHRVSQACLPWRFGNSYYRGQRVYRMQAPHGEHERFFPMNNLQQQYVEEYLLEACAVQPLIEMRWGNRLISLEQHHDHAMLSVDTPAGQYDLQASWVVAADGARSGIRSHLGLKMQGASYEGRFVIADIRCDLPFPTERQAFFDPPWNPGNTVLLHREPHGIWRVDYQVPAHETDAQALDPTSLSTRINAILEQVGHAGKPWEMDWSSVYSARTLSLESYLHGRVLFAGDAAHLLPIFGVRGANTGFQDAQALGWQLAMVARAVASPRLLENYSRERVGAAWEIITEAGKSTRFMTPPTYGFRLLRDAVLSLSLTQEFVRPLYHWRTSRPHEYRDSWLNATDDDTALFNSGPGHGAPPQNIRLGESSFLLDHLGGGFDLLIHIGDAPLCPDLLEAIHQLDQQGIALRLITVGSHPGPQDSDLHLDDPGYALRNAYGLQQVGGAYLFRPDQHICARWKTLDGTRLRNAIFQALLLNNVFPDKTS
jgi:3-(3-hydroxy-phenyl)propionate hydroxylase